MEIITDILFNPIVLSFLG